MIKGKKHKQTIAHEITRETKEKVWKRQHGKSLFSNRTITVDMCCCHYVSRAQGGVGYEWNIFGCYQSPWCNEHDAFDGKLSEKEVRKMLNLTAEEMKTVAGNHLKRNYNNWSIENCTYKKWYEENDYGVTRREK